MGRLTTHSSSTTVNKERAEKILEWKKKLWLDFCRLVMEEDKRYTITPLKDFHTKRSTVGMDFRVQDAEGLFSNVCLTRTGYYDNIYITPSSPQLGISIEAGSKYGAMIFSGVPSKAMVWPILRIADELERQYGKEVSIESNKHGSLKGGSNARTNSGVGGYSNTDSVSASDITDR